MLELIKPNINYNFVGKFNYSSTLSSIVIAVCLLLIFKGLNYGVDFRGGAEIQIKFQNQVELGEIRDVLTASGHKSALVQTIGEKQDNEFIVKVAGTEGNLNKVTEKVSKYLSDKFSQKGVRIRKVDIVGPKAGANLRIAGFTAMAWALIAIMVYIGLRFDFKYSPGAIIALLHDILIILGIFALTHTEFTLQTVAALLAVIGYSVNDTVIVYDRVREHEEKYAGVALKDHINNAINETLSRTILTSGTTLFISVTMFFAGGPAIKDFFFAITCGVFAGTYSSIFVAAPITLLFDKYSKKA